MENNTTKIIFVGAAVLLGVRLLKGNNKQMFNSNFKVMEGTKKSGGKKRTTATARKVMTAAAKRIRKATGKIFARARKSAAKATSRIIRTAKKRVSK